LGGHGSISLHGLTEKVHVRVHLFFRADSLYNF